MITVRVGKAKATVDDVEDVTILIGPEETEEFEGEDYRIRYASYYSAVAGRLEHALHGALPGGTYDALAVAMMERRSSLLRVPLPVVKEEKSGVVTTVPEKPGYCVYCALLLERPSTRVMFILDGVEHRFTSQQGAIAILARLKENAEEAGRHFALSVETGDRGTIHMGSGGMYAELMIGGDSVCVLHVIDALKFHRRG